MQKEHGLLVQLVEKLWNRIGASEAEKQTMLSEGAQKSSYQSIRELKDVAAECQKILRDNMAKLIDKLRVEKIAWMEKLHLDEPDHMDVDGACILVVSKFNTLCICLKFSHVSRAK